jgi:microcystin-dependent protein
MDEYIGIIKVFAGNFAPQNWEFCAGQILNISTNAALFSILGTTYGGNGTNTFGLPDLRGRVVIGTTNISGSPLSNYALGQTGGSENVTLTTNQMPQHTHGATFTPSGGGGSLKASSSDGAAPAPSSTNPTLAAAKDPDGNITVNMYNAATPDITLNTGASGGGGTVAIAPAGGSMPVSILQPYLSLNYIICTYGIFPPRP